MLGFVIIYPPETKSQQDHHHAHGEDPVTEL